MIGVKPLFSGRSLGEGETATFDVALVAPDGKMLTGQGAALRIAQDRSRAISTIAATAAGSTSRSSRRGASPTAGSMSTPDKPGRIAAPVQWGRYRLEVSSADADGPVTSIGFDAGWYTEASADTPDMLEIALDKPEYKPGESMTVAVTARAAGRVTLNVMGDKLLQLRHPGGAQPGTAQHQGPGRLRLGHRRLCGGDPAPSARRRRRSACRAAPSACSGSRSTARRTRWRST